jgi:glutamate N-acetyltransferase/amino-acid N-acetyltransferase
MEHVFLESGGVTSPKGFVAGGVVAGIKTYGVEPRFDVGVLASTVPCVVAGVFTKNQVVGAPVELCRARVEGGRARAVVVNSGCSNVAMGDRGRKDARRMAELAATRLGIPEEEMLVASTGVIGRPLPLDAIGRGIDAIRPTESGGSDFSRAIMTTDTVAKSRAVRVTAGGITYTVGGTAKGSGMVHPDMATVLCFMTTDAPVDAEWLRQTLRSVADVSLNMVDVDMDTSTSDTMLLFANGAAGGAPIGHGHPAEEPLLRAIEAVAIALAKDLARDGEGAKTLIEVRVEGARSLEDARIAARTVSASPLVKTMVTGRDPNLGRVMMAIGRSGARVDVDRTSVWIGDECAFERGAPTSVPYDDIKRAMNAKDVLIRVDLGLGTGAATAWGCDLTEEYVHINGSYTT